MPEEKYLLTIWVLGDCLSGGTQYMSDSNNHRQRRLHMVSASIDDLGILQEADISITVALKPFLNQNVGAWEQPSW
jgi:hypothetical protein